MSRIPLYYQFPDVVKAAKSHKRDSYETFRDNEIQPTQYREMENRPGLGQETRIRRYPNGDLDYRYVLDQIIDAVRSASYNKILLPIEAALITVVLPLKYRKMEPQQAELLTQLSATEKEKLKLMFMKHEMEVANWAAGYGGGHMPPNNQGG